MEQIEALVDAYEARMLSRRDLIAALAALAVPASAGASVPQPSSISAAAQGRSLNHASLAVSDVAAAADFYQRLLGISVVSRPGNGGINLGSATAFSASTNCRIPAR